MIIIDRPLVSYLIAGLSLLLFLAAANDWLQPLLQYQRDANWPQLWRLLTGHIAHTNYWHALLNGGGLLLLLLLFDQRERWWRWLLLNTALALFISLWLLLFCPHLDWYVGYSGILHGLFAYAAVRLWPADWKLAAIWLGGLSTKVIAEQVWPGITANTADLIGKGVITQAHLAGFLGGVLAGLSASVWPLFRQGQS